VNEHCSFAEKESSVPRLGKPRNNKGKFMSWIKRLLDKMVPNDSATQGVDASGGSCLSASEKLEVSATPNVSVLRLQKAGRLYLQEDIPIINSAIEPVQLIKLLEDDDIHITSNADILRALKQKLVRLGTAAVPALVRGLNYGTHSARYVMVEVLGDIGDLQAVPDLLELLSEDAKGGNHSYVVLAQALGKLGDERAIPALEAILSFPKSIGMTYERDFVEHALENLRSVSGLVEGLKSGDLFTRLDWASRLSKMGWRPKTPEQRLLFALARIDQEQLVKIGSPAVPGLLEMLKDQKYRNNPVLIETLGEIGDAQAIPYLLEAMKTKEMLGGKERKRTIGAVLLKIGWQSRTIKERVLFDIHAGYWDELVELGSQGLPDLLEALGEADVYDYRDIIRVLGRIGDVRAVPVLASVLNHVTYGKFAAESLRRIKEREGGDAEKETTEDKRRTLLLTCSHCHKSFRIGEDAVVMDSSRNVKVGPIGFPALDASIPDIVYPISSFPPKQVTALLSQAAYTATIIASSLPNNPNRTWNCYCCQHPNFYVAASADWGKM
jgi:HEAT repeat protein